MTTIQIIPQSSPFERLPVPVVGKIMAYAGDIDQTSQVSKIFSAAAPDAIAERFSELVYSNPERTQYRDNAFARSVQHVVGERGERSAPRHRKELFQMVHAHRTRLIAELAQDELYMRMKGYLDRERSLSELSFEEMNKCRSKLNFHRDLELVGFFEVLTQLNPDQPQISALYDEVRHKVPYAAQAALIRTWLQEEQTQILFAGLQDHGINHLWFPLEAASLPGYTQADKETMLVKTIIDQDERTLMAICQHQEFERPEPFFAEANLDPVQFKMSWVIRGLLVARDASLLSKVKRLPEFSDPPPCIFNDPIYFWYGSDRNKGLYAVLRTFPRFSLISGETINDMLAKFGRGVTRSWDIVRELLTFPNVHVDVMNADLIHAQALQDGQHDIVRKMDDYRPGFPLVPLSRSRCERLTAYVAPVAVAAANALLAYAAYRYWYE